MIRRIRLPLAAVGACVAALIGAGAAVAATPGADCQPYTKRPCLLPFPNNLLTKVDHSTPTGLRVHLPAAAMPVNKTGSRIKVGEYDRADGFSPGSAIIVHVRGLDNARAFSRTGAATLSNMGRSLRKLAWCTARAINSLPVPLSPVIRTQPLVRASRAIFDFSSSIPGQLPMISPGRGSFAARLS